MLRKTLIAVALVSSMAISAPALAGGKGHGCRYGCSTSTSTSGGHTSTSSSGGNTSSSSGGSSSGTQVPEPGMLALFGAGLLGLGYATRRRRRAA